LSEHEPDRGPGVSRVVIEDAHVNIGGILEHLHAFLEVGDYVIVEDVEAEAELLRFLSKHPGAYKVDTRYTDYFGHNTTCAPDQILVRTEHTSSTRRSGA
jgi:cephalosporin hydroxylase